MQKAFEEIAERLSDEYCSSSKNSSSSEMGEKRCSNKECPYHQDKKCPAAEGCAGFEEA